MDFLCLIFVIFEKKKKCIGYYLVDYAKLDCFILVRKIRWFIDLFTYLLILNIIFVIIT